SHVSNFYTATKKATYLFRDAQIMPLDKSYIDPSIDEAPKPFVLLYEKDTNDKRIPWVVDLDKGRLIQGRPAQHFINRQPKRAKIIIGMGHKNPCFRGLPATGKLYTFE